MDKKLNKALSYISNNKIKLAIIGLLLTLVLLVFLPNYLSRKLSKCDEITYTKYRIDKLEKLLKKQEKNNFTEFALDISDDRDIYGNSFLLKSDENTVQKFFIYSSGKNGIDEQGNGDDIVLSDKERFSAEYSCN